MYGSFHIFKEFYFLVSSRFKNVFLGPSYSLGDLAGEGLGSTFLPQAPVHTLGAAGDQGWADFTSWSVMPSLCYLHPEGQ